jgi:hypothetical protein
MRWTFTHRLGSIIRRKIMCSCPNTNTLPRGGPRMGLAKDWLPHTHTHSPYIRPPPIRTPSHLAVPGKSAAMPELLLMRLESNAMRLLPPLASNRDQGRLIRWEINRHPPTEAQRTDTFCHPSIRHHENLLGRHASVLSRFGQAHHAYPSTNKEKCGFSVIPAAPSPIWCRHTGTRCLALVGS